MYKFNVRAYGLLIDDNNRILISDEKEHGTLFAKFPGGGLEYGEGLRDCLKREFMEECQLSIEVLSHFYTVDFFEKSHFNDSQLVTVYYFVRPLEPLKLTIKQKPFDFDSEGDVLQSFRLISMDELSEDDVTFDTDKMVIRMLKQIPKDELSRKR